MELLRSTYDPPGQGDGDHCRQPAECRGELGINRAEMLTPCKLIDPDETTSPAEEIAGRGALASVPSHSGVITKPARTTSENPAKVSISRQREGGPPPL